MSPSRPELTLEQIEQLIATTGSLRAAAREIGIPESTLRGMRQRAQAGIEWIEPDEEPEAPAPRKTRVSEHEREVLREAGLDPRHWTIQSAGMNPKGGVRYSFKPRVSTDTRENKKQAAEPRVKRAPYGGDEEAITIARGLNPDEWMIEGFDANGQPKGFKRRPPTLPIATEHEPPVIDQPIHTPGTSRMIAGLGCQHGQHADPDLHRLACAALATVIRPTDVIMLGDGGDYAELGPWKGQAAPGEAQLSLNAERQIAADYKAAAPEASHYWMPGNHGLRYDREARAKAGVFGTLTYPGTSEPIISLAGALGLKELGVTGIIGEGRHAMPIIPGVLNAMHGQDSKPRGGQAAQAMVEATRVGVMQADTHKQAVAWVTTVDPATGERTDRLAMEVGVMANPATVPGAGPTQNWQQGFGTVEIHEDGTISADLASYRSGVLTWRGIRWWIGDDGAVHTTAQTA